MKYERRTEVLSCVLTDEEIRERGEEAARNQAERDRVEALRQSTQKEAKGAVEALEGEIRRLLGEVRAKSTSREVEVVDQRNEFEHMIETVRTDTGETVRRRAMTPDEMQTVLFPAAEERGEDAAV